MTKSSKLMPVVFVASGSSEVCVRLGIVLASSIVSSLFFSIRLMRANLWQSSTCQVVVVSFCVRVVILFDSLVG